VGVVSNLYTETLKRAAVICGGEQQLALHLKVTPSHLALWIAGTESPPARIFLKAVDVLTDYDVAHFANAVDDNKNDSGRP
jgi:hypothetical protein